MKFKMTINSPGSTIYHIEIDDDTVNETRLGEIAAYILAPPGPPLPHEQLCKGIHITGDLLAVHEPLYDGGKEIGEEINFIRRNAIESIRIEIKNP